MGSPLDDDNEVENGHGTPPAEGSGRGSEEPTTQTVENIFGDAADVSSS